MTCPYCHESHFPIQLPPGISEGLTAVNAVVIVTGRKWSDIVRLDIEQAKKRSQMPDYESCIKNMIIESGFSRLKVNTTLGDLIQLLNEDKSKGLKFVVRLDFTGYLAIVPDENADAPSYLVKGHLRTLPSLAYRTVQDLWLYTVTAGGEKIKLRETKNHLSRTQEHRELAVKNMNPLGRNIGDCAVRALSAACDCTWSEAIDMLAAANGYTDTVINRKTYIDVALIKAGFERHKKIVRSHGTVIGKDFCDELSYTYHNGERVLAYLGKGHCGAILPFTQADGRVRYKVQDTWDSTGRKVEEYWVLDPKKLEREKRAQERKKEKTARCDDLSVGQTITHPTFGNGVIISEQNGILEIEFEKVGKKKLAASWLRKI